MPSQKNEMEEIQAELKKYPSSFDVFENLPVSTEDIRKIKVKLLLDEKSEEYDTEMELHRIWNLISFLCFVLRDHTGAEKYVEKVLKSDSGNMIALSNKTWFSLKQCSMNQQYKDNCKKLEGLKKNSLPCLVAKAEIAFTYSRLGVKRYEKAKSLYKNVIDECNEIMEKDENKDSKLLTSYLCVWMFGYALVQKRLLNFSNTFDETKLDLSADNYGRVIELYCRIIQQEECSKCVRRYRARSYTELGFLAYTIQTMALSDVSIKHPDNVDLPEQTEDYFTTAFEIFPDDVYILERSGQYYRYARNIELSIQLLEKAIKLKGTSLAYHHLALSKRRKLDIDVGNCRVFKSSFTSNKPRSMTPVKSPLKPKPIDYRSNIDVADEIIRCFDKSIEISFNTAAMYDKGLFYRQLWVLDKALESFESLIRNEEGHSSRVELANAFEQAGLCLGCMLKQENRKEKGKDLELKMKLYLKSSIEISCSLVANIPALKSCWKSTSTLASIIGDASTKENKEDLLFLYEKMDRHKEALEVLKELEELAQTPDESVKIREEKVKKYITLGLYDDAVIALSTLPNVLDTIGEDMCLQIYVEAGIDALKNGYDGTARNRIQRALEIGNRDKINDAHAKPNVASVEERYDIDIFILCNTEDEGNGKKLMDIMIRMGVQTTLNTDRLLPGTSMLSGMTDEMKKSNHFMIIFDFDADDKGVANRMRHLTERLQSIVEARETGSSTIIVIKAISCDTVPDMFLGYKTIDMELHTIPEDFTKNETACKSVKELLIALSSSS